MEQYAELKTSNQKAAELEGDLDDMYKFSETVKPEFRNEMQAYYEGMLYAAGILFSVAKDKHGKHHIKPYPMD